MPDPSSLKKDHRLTVRRAKAQGFKFVRSAGNHYKVYDPQGNYLTSTGTTPSDHNGYKNLKADLDKAGYLPPDEFKRRKKEAARAERLAAAREQDQEGTTDDSQESDDVPKLGDVARVTQAKDKSADGELMPAAQILKDLPMAAELLWEKVIEKIKEEGPHPLVVGTVSGYRWEGSRDEAIRDLWPSIRRSTPGQAVDPRKLALARYMKTTQNMVCLDQGNRYKKSVWWVRASFSRTELSNEAQTNMERRLTAQEAGEDRAPAPVTVSRFAPDNVLDTRCPECALEINAADLDEHRLKEHAICIECGKRGHDYRTIQIHRSTVHKVRSADYERNRATRDLNAGLTPVHPDAKGFLHCPDCRLATTSPTLFGEHRRSLINQPHPDPIFGCRLCPERDESANQIRHHYEEAHGSSVTVCRRCGEVYPDRRQLYDHKVTAHKVRRTREHGELYPGDPGYDLAGEKSATFEEDTEPRDVSEMINLVETLKSPETHELGTTPAPRPEVDPDADAIAYFESLIRYQTDQRQTITSLELHLQELEREAAELRTENNRLKSNVAHTAEVRNLKKELASVTAERDRLRATLTGMREAFKGLGIGD